MSLHTAAQHLASKGRGDDKMLIHMTPKEVGGLQALAMAHGGSLTINPDTGLPEAGFLKNLLPTIIGAGLTFMSGGALNPATIGMLAGGIETVRTGDLGKGIMAGLGAYGGAGLGASFAGSAASATPSFGAQAAGTSAMQAEAANQAAALNFGADGINQAATAMPGSNFGFNTDLIAKTGQDATSQFASQGLGSQVKGSLSAIGQPGGFGDYGSNLVSQFGSPTKAAVGAFGVAAPLMPQPQMPTPPAPEKSNYEGPYVPSPRDVRFKSPEDRSSSEFSYFNPSNPVPGFRPMSIYAQGGEINPDYNANINLNSSMSDQFAVGGLTALAAGGQGRFLQGPGDGTSDSIPAVIGNRQPARLADGEFVVDARTVSELGNGSSKAGAQKLYKMMDRIHGARKKVGRGQDSKAEKYLPA